MKGREALVTTRTREPFRLFVCPFMYDGSPGGFALPNPEPQTPNPENPLSPSGFFLA